MGKKQEGAPPPHPHTVIMWVVGVLLTTSVALCGLFFKASAQTTTNIADGNIVSVPGNQNNVTVQAPPRERKQLGGGFGCANSKGVKMFNNYSHDNAGEGLGLHGCDDAEVTGNISEHNGYPAGAK